MSQIRDGATVHVDTALDAASEFLGPGYKSNVGNEGRFVSADGLRVVRMGDNDILGKHSGAPHMNFESLAMDPTKGKLTAVDNMHVFIKYQTKMDYSIFIPDQGSGSSVRLHWDSNFILKVDCEGSQIHLQGNREGFISLARHLITLAIHGNTHIHLDEFNSLEPGSKELILDCDADMGSRNAA